MKIQRFLFAAVLMLAGTTAAQADPRYNWRGFYLGAHAGGQWGSFTDLSYGGGDPSQDGWVGGVVAGMNWQTGNWVFGVEGDVGFGTSSGSNISGGGFIQDADVRFVGNLRARLGFAMDRTLLFVAGGASWAEAELTHSPGGAGATTSEMHFGWTVGGGVDWAASKNWLVRLEYLYAAYDKKSYDFFGGDIHDIRFDSNNIVRGAIIYKW